METLYRAGLSNAVSATFLALLVACLGRLLRGGPLYFIASGCLCW